MNVHTIDIKIVGEPAPAGSGEPIAVQLVNHWHATDGRSAPENLAIMSERIIEPPADIKLAEGETWRRVRYVANWKE